MVSPAQMLRCRCNLVGDASGGTQQIIFDMDPVFDALVANAMVQVAGAGAAVVCDITVNEDRYSGAFDHFVGITASLAYNSTNSTARGLWTPPPLLLEDISRTASGSSARVTAQIANGGAGVTLQFLVDILLFNKRAFEFVPLDALVGSLGRATHFT